MFIIVWCHGNLDQKNVVTMVLSEIEKKKKKGTERLYIFILAGKIERDSVAVSTFQNYLAVSV